MNESIVQSLPVEEEEVQCSGHEHYPFSSLNQVFSLPVDTVFDYVFTDCPFNRKFQLARRASGNFRNLWPEKCDSDGEKTRHVDYNVTVSYALGTKVSNTHEKQVIHKTSRPGEMYVIDAEVTNSGLPYTDSFYVVNRVCITKVNQHMTRVRATSQILFKKAILKVFKNLIERNTHQGIMDHYRLLGKHLTAEELSTLADSSGGLHSPHTHRMSNDSSSRLGVENDSDTTQLPGDDDSDNRQHIPAHQTMIAAAADKRRANRRRNRRNIGFSRSQSQVQNTTSSSFNSTDTFVRVICAILIVLISFNAMLFYKLWSLEEKARVISKYRNLPYIEHSELNADHSFDWLSLLKNQQKSHDEEIAKWKNVVSSTVHLIKQIEATLYNLDLSIQNSLDEDFTHKYDMEPREQTSET